MLFRLINAPVIFQGLINYILYNCLDKYIVAYLDNILIFSRILEEYKKYVAQVLEKLQKENLILRSDKYQFYI